MVLPVVGGDVHAGTSREQLHLLLAAHAGVRDREGQAQVRDIALHGKKKKRIVGKNKIIYAGTKLLTEQ